MTQGKETCSIKVGILFSVATQLILYIQTLYLSQIKDTASYIIMTYQERKAITLSIMV